MGQRSPLVTLAAAAAGFVVLLVVNSTQNTTSTAPPGGDATTAPASTAPATPPPSSPPTSPATTPTATPTATATNEVAAVYAGRTDGREATLAVAVKGGRAAAYVCDGRRVEAWLTGTFVSGRLTLRSRAGDVLTGNLTGDAVSGTVTVRGRELGFAIDKADPPAGLYRARTENNGAVSVIGWIVLPDGTQVGIENDSTPGPAPQLDPASRTTTVGGATVTAASIAGDETF